MKNYVRMLSLAAIAAGTCTMFYSCKKGPNDPFLSLRSRKARVAGEWTIVRMVDEFQSTFNSTNSSGQVTGSSKNTIEIDDDDVTFSAVSTQQSSFGSGNDTETGAGSAVAHITFEKDGTFEMTMEMTNMNMTVVSEFDGVPTTYNYMQTLTIERTGTWNFLGGIEKEYKNKERIMLNIREEKGSANLSMDGEFENSADLTKYGDGEFVEIWHLDQLKNKEIVLKGTYEGSGNFSSTSSSGYNSSGTSSTEGTRMMTLQQD